MRTDPHQRRFWITRCSRLLPRRRRVGLRYRAHVLEGGRENGYQGQFQRRAEHALVQQCLSTEEQVEQRRVAQSLDEGVGQRRQFAVQDRGEQSLVVLAIERRHRAEVDVPRKPAARKPAARKSTSSGNSSSRSTASQNGSGGGVVGTVKSAASKVSGPAVAIGATAVGVAGGLVLKGTRRQKTILGVPVPRKVPSVDVKKVAKTVGKASKQFGETSKSVSKDIERVGDQAERIGKILG